MNSNDSPAFGAIPPFQGCLPGLVISRAKISPDAVAVVGPEYPAVTYGALAAHVDETVCSFNETGIGRNDRVAIALPKGAWL